MGVYHLPEQTYSCSGRLFQQKKDYPGIMDTYIELPEKSILIPAADAARMCGLSRSAFYKLVSSGRAPKPIKLGRASRWPRKLLVDWIAAGCPAQ